MRLVCPNCEAKYEVPDDAIPEAGRDVQCANCGHSWFQMRHKAVQTEEAPATVAEPFPEPVAQPEAASAEPVAGAEPVVDTVTGDDAATEDDEVAVQTPSVAAAVAATVADEIAPKAPVGHAVDESVLAILREEADREAIARKADVRALESQPDLGLDAAISPAPPRAAALLGEDLSAKPSARRDLLPNVEEINSTLRPSENPEADDIQPAAPMVVAEARSGFRSGFLVVMTLAILGMAVYLSAPQLGSAIPALADPLDAYVGFIDSMRLQLDGLMKSATVAINGEAG